MKKKEKKRKKELSHVYVIMRKIPESLSTDDTVIEFG
jgi:hypothetical protein